MKIFCYKVLIYMKGEYVYEGRVELVIFMYNLFFIYFIFDDNF